MISVQKKAMGATLIAAALSTGALRPARAVVLEQKFQAGQSALYDVSLVGTVNVNASDQTPVPWAGMPLSVPISGNGQIAFDTISTDASGGATVATRIPNAKMTANVFGMSALLTAKNGIGSFSLNGAPGKTFPLDFLVNPTYALNVSRLGKIEGVSPLTKDASAKTATSSTRNAPKIAKVADDKTSQSAMGKWLASMPEIWPNRDLQNGDSWSIDAKVPVANAPGGVLDLGAVNFKLIGQETVNGVALQHVSLAGTLTIDDAKAAILNEAKPKSDGARGSMKIVSDSKTVSGDLWFDANAGRLSRANVKIVATSALSGTTKPDAQGKTRAWNSTQGFNGTFAMQFSGVSAAPVQTAAKTPQKSS